MRKQQKTVLWPSYIDSLKTRKEGRRVSRNIGVPSPMVAELHEAAERLKMKPETEADCTHPACPWKRTGRVLVLRKGTKRQTVTRIAAEIATARQRAKK